jgi:hypothetical protein
MEVALAAILTLALCVGMAVYIVWPHGCKPKPPQNKPQQRRTIDRDDLGSDDQNLFDSYMASPTPKDKDPLLYSTLLYSHRASGDRANSAERSSRIALGFTVGALLATLIGLPFFNLVLLFIGLTALSWVIWSNAFLSWIRGKRNP